MVILISLYAPPVVTLHTHIPTNMALASRYKLSASQTVPIVVIPGILIICMKGIVFHPAAISALIYLWIIMASICRDYFIALNTIDINQIGEVIWTFWLATVTATRQNAAVMARVFRNKLSTGRTIPIGAPALMKSCIHSYSAPRTPHVSKKVHLDESHIYANIRRVQKTCFCCSG